MTSLEELELAVDALSESEYSQFRQWFLERDWEKWDRELEADAAEGKLDFLLHEVEDAKRKGALRGL